MTLRVYGRWLPQGRGGLCSAGSCIEIDFAAGVPIALSRIIALYYMYCTAYPLYIRSTNIVDTAISEATMHATES
jgi:hypothetical protein